MITTQTTEKPFIKWVGGKTQILSELVKRLPNNIDRYHEPFLGGAALFFHLQPRQAFLSDINEELMNAYKVVKFDVEGLITDLRKHVYESDYFYNIRQADRRTNYIEWTPLERASRFIYLNKTCYNGLYRVNSDGFFNTPFGSYKNPTICDEDNLRLCSKALQYREISVTRYHTVYDRANAEDFIYFDPPYAPLTATANFTGYSKGGFGNLDQEELCKLCARLDKKGVKWMLSNSSAPLILELYRDYNLEFISATRAINSKGDLRGKVKEVIVRNYQ